MNYKYIAFDTHQELTSGIIAAEGEEEAERLIQNHNLKVITLTPVKPKFNFLKVKILEDPLSQKEIIYFIRQASSLLKAGIPIVRALSLIQEQATSSNLRESVGKIISEIKRGSSLSSAISKQKKSFPLFTIRLIEIGEKSGNIDDVLKHILSFNLKEMETKRKIKKALTYPAMVISMAIVVFILMITVIMPPFLALFQELGTELPLPTRILMGISGLPGFMTTGKLLVLVILLLLLALYIRSREGKKNLHLLLLKVPVLGGIVLSQNLSRISRSLAIQLNSGVNLTESLFMTEQMTGNLILKKEIGRIKKAVTGGEPLHSALQKSSIFPSVVKQMVQVGEETGSLESNLTFLADYYEEESGEKTESMVAMIEPTVTIVLGAMVALMALAIVTPTFSIMDSIK